MLLASHRPGDAPCVTASVERETDQSGLSRSSVQRRIGVHIAERRDQVVDGRARPCLDDPADDHRHQRCRGDKRKERLPHAPRVQCRHGKGCQRDDHDGRPSGIRTERVLDAPLVDERPVDGLQRLDEGKRAAEDRDRTQKRPAVPQPRDGDEHDEQRDPDPGTRLRQQQNGGHEPRSRGAERTAECGLARERGHREREPDRAQVRLGAVVTDRALEAATVEPFGRDGAGERANPDLPRVEGDPGEDGRKHESALAGRCEQRPESERGRREQRLVEQPPRLVRQSAPCRRRDAPAAERDERECGDEDEPRRP